MTKFDKFVVQYAEMHTVHEVVIMLQSHIAYINFCKYDKNVKAIKADDNKIAHINAMLKYINMTGDLRGYF